MPLLPWCFWAIDTVAGKVRSSARQVAATFGLPLPAMMNTLKALARQGLVESQRGVAGGYELAMPPEAVSLLAVVRAVEGEGEMAAEPTADACSEAPGEENADRQTTGGVAVRRLQQRVDGFLQGLTVADLLDDSEAKRPSRGAAPADFVALRRGLGNQARE